MCCTHAQVVNNAGVGELCGPLSGTDDVGALVQKVIDVDLTAVVEGTRLALQVLVLGLFFF